MKRRKAEFNVLLLTIRRELKKTYNHEMFQNSGRPPTFFRYGGGMQKFEFIERIANTVDKIPLEVLRKALFFKQRL